MEEGRKEGFPLNDCLLDCLLGKKEWGTREEEEESESGCFDATEELVLVECIVFRFWEKDERREERRFPFGWLFVGLFAWENGVGTREEEEEGGSGCFGATEELVLVEMCDLEFSLCPDGLGGSS